MQKKATPDEDEYKHFTFEIQKVHGIYESTKDSNGNPLKGQRTYVKLELQLERMDRECLHFIAMTETWDECNWNREFMGKTVFSTNNDVKTSRTGVMIILFEAATRQAAVRPPHCLTC